MIKRLLSFALLIWILGFAWFGLSLPRPAKIIKTDGVVVLTGGTNRIEKALRVLESKQAKRLLISGVDSDVKPHELAVSYHRPDGLFTCCIDLGFESIDTRSNGLETARWVVKNKFKSVRLITNDWHMRRARLELNKSLPNDVKITNDAVPSPVSLAVLFKEYNKYWIRALASALGI